MKPNEKNVFPRNNVFGEMKNGFFYITRAYIFFSFEPLGGFDPPIAQTKGPVKRKSSAHFRLDPSLCGTVRSFSRFFPQLRRTALFTRIDPRCILELLVDISPTVAPVRAFV